jgi:hypothetical protein
VQLRLVEGNPDFFLAFDDDYDYDADFADTA